MATSEYYSAPRAENEEDLERKYWKSVKTVPPIYGCDVASPLSDQDLNVMNIAKLDTILKHVEEDLDIVIQGEKKNL